MGLIRGVTFDLDDTLYLEKEYIKSGFTHIASYLQKLSDISNDRFFNYLWDLFEQGLRGNLFNKLLEAYPELSSPGILETLIHEYRCHTPNIKPLPQTLATISFFKKRDIRIGLISDGPLSSQQAKIKALGFDSLFDPLILTDTWGRQFWKPHPRSFEKISATWDCEPDELMYIGDNPEKDFVSPKKLGWHTIRIRSEEQLRFQQDPVSTNFAPDSEISSLKDLETMDAFRLC